MSKVYADFDVEHGTTSEGWWCSITAHATNARAITLVITDKHFSKEDAIETAKRLLVTKINAL